VSAIVGLFRLEGAPEIEGDLDIMLSTVRHRGPDGLSSWRDDSVSVGFGYAALFSKGESLAEGQPLRRRESGVVVVADARIDNRETLAHQLGVVANASLSDASLIARAYERWGRDCADRLVGDFAFAIWDPRRGKVFCARDVMGVKPLYYVHTARLFAFATEAKALLALPDVSHELNDEALRGFMSLDDAHLSDRSGTLYRSISRLPAAHFFEVDDGDVSVTRYWDLNAERETRYASTDQYVEHFRHCFAEAVQARLRTTSSHGIGATLSGGLDSSSIVCVARGRLRGSRNPLHTFSLIFPDLSAAERSGIDERRFIEDVLRMGDVQSHLVRGDHVSPLSDLERVLWHLDEAFFAPNLYLHWAMYREAQQQGVRVLLDGFDGDSAIGHGVGRLGNLLIAKDWGTFESEVRAFATNHDATTSAVLRLHGYPYLRSLALSGDWPRWWEATAQLSRRFQLSRAMTALNYGLRPWIRRRPSSVHRERELHIQGISQPLYQITLEIADKAAAAFCVEPRYPFFDRRLIEFCVGIPESQKFSGGWSRLILRRGMEGILPPTVQWRARKANLSANFYRALGTTDRARIANATYSGVARYTDKRALATAWTKYSVAGNGYKSTATLLFRATTLATWLSMLGDNVGSATAVRQQIRREAGSRTHAVTA
jgi:asparagine synthase (glutamine-hydrolysing)